MVLIYFHAGNFPPTISADSLLQINIGVAVEYTLIVVDPIDSVTLSIEGGLPDNSALTSLGDGTYVFRWNLDEPTTKTLVFIANDSRGAAASFVPRVEVCACKNGGVCTLDGVLTSNSTILLHCLCTEGTTYCAIRYECFLMLCGTNGYV